jgi:hypothetical protein
LFENAQQAALVAPQGARDPGGGEEWRRFLHGSRRPFPRA